MSDPRIPAPPLAAPSLGESPWPRRQPLDAPQRATAWAVPWSDLMMTMFVLFAVLYAIQGARLSPAGAREAPVQAVIAAVAPPAQPLPGTLQQAEAELVRLQEAPGVLTVERLEHGVRLALSPEVAAKTQVVAQAGAILAALPVPVQVVVHAAGPGAWPETSRLAQTVAQTLVAQGVAEDRLWVTARGAAPTADPALAQGWVDIVLGAAAQLPPPRPRADDPHLTAWLHGGR